MLKKEIFNKMRRECDKIFVSHILDQGLISKIYKELTHLNNKKIN